MSTALFCPTRPAEATVRELQRELKQRRRELAARELAIGDLRGSLMSFEGRYIRQVGILYKQLDEWHAKRNALHNKTEDAALAEENCSDPLPLEATETTTLRQLFRDLAKRIHPDFATDAADAVRRTRLMAQANEAFLRNDRATLERMLHGHDIALAFSSHEATEAAVRSLRAQLAHLGEDLTAAEAEFHTLSTSELAQLREGVLAAAREGRDLLAEMAIRVQGLIGIAMRQYELDLDRIQRPPRGLQVDSLLSAEDAPLAVLRYDPKRRTWLR